MRIFYDLDEYFKNPVEAVKENQSILFKVRLPNYYKDDTVAIILHHYSNKEHKVVIMEASYFDAQETVFEGEFIAEEIGVWWYNFKISKTLDIVEYIMPGENYEGVICGFLDQMLPMEQKYWRLSVYKKDFKTPSWLKGGIVYQIFPDRFYNNQKNFLSCKENSREREWNNFPCWSDIYEFMGSFRDFYGGTLMGIGEKIDYLHSLGVTCIYLNPVFESSSSHRYNTADYEKIDPMLGNNEDFVNLCNIAKQRGIRVVLDGVFSHSGSDSKYFDKYNKYNNHGAFQAGKESKYYKWYQFYQWPHYYKSWWNYDSLPKLRQENDECKNYFLGEKGIVDKWLSMGASGWRLDAVDDLPDFFLNELRDRVKKNDDENVIIGEVWHDASLIKYVEHDVYNAKFLYGDQLDSLTNYQFRDFILEYVFEKNAQRVMGKILRLISNYPKPAVDILWNILGSHDTARVLTVFGKGKELGEKRGYIEENYWLDDTEKSKAIKLMKIVSAIQYTLPGIPCVYYGDEVGVEGYNDPYSRSPFPWGNKNEELLEWYSELGKMRQENDIFKSACLKDLGSKDGMLCYCRKLNNISIHCYFSVTESDIKINNNIDEENCKFLLGTHFKRMCDEYYIEAFGVVIFLYMANDDI